MPTPASEPAASGPPHVAGPRGGEFTVLEAARILLLRRRLLVQLPAALAVVVLLVSLLLPRTWTVTAGFAPQSAAASLGALANLASQFGVAIPGADQSESPDFYADLLTGRPILREVVGATYQLPDGEGRKPGTLMEYYGEDGDTPEARRENAVDDLLDEIVVNIGLKTGVVSFSVRSRDPEVATEIAQNALANLDAFDLRTRQTQAAAQRRFIGGRVADADSGLRQAEDRLQGFLQRNRDFSGSPQLSFERDRLQREVDLRHQVYTNLVQAYEQAKIDEVRNTPVLSIVEPPIVPAEPDSRYLALKLVLALVAGLGIAMVLAFLQAALRPGPAGLTRGESEELASLWSATRVDLRRPWRLLLPAPRSGTG